MIIQRLPLKFDLALLQKDVERLMEICPFHPMLNQISLTHRPDASEPFYDGIGGLYNPVTRVFSIPETEFHHFNSDLRDWYLYSVYEQLTQFVKKPLVRVRAMRLLPKACLSMHVDVSPRIHIPVFSNSQCYFIFTEEPAQHMPADGSAYLVDTTHFHSVMNGSADEQRIHLVFATT